MFNNIFELEANKDSIMGIMRSSMVCLYILLKNVDLVKQSTSLVTAKDLGVNSTIVEQLEAILFAADQEQFRQDFISALYAANMSAEANIFNERREIAKSLPQDTLNHTKGLLSMLSTGEQWFVDWLWSFMRQEHESTQEAGAGLVADYFPWLGSYFYDASDDEQENINYYGNSSNKANKLLVFSTWLSGNQEHSVNSHQESHQESNQDTLEPANKKMKYTI